LESEPDASDIDSDIHRKKHKMKSKKHYHWASDHKEDSNQAKSLGGGEGGREKTATGIEGATDDTLQTEGN